jgi:hypothetical protein
MKAEGTKPVYLQQANRYFFYHDKLKNRPKYLCKYKCLIAGHIRATAEKSQHRPTSFTSYSISRQLIQATCKCLGKVGNNREPNLNETKN